MHIKLLVAILIGVACFIAMPSTVLAEISPIPGDFGWKRGVPLHLIDSEAVQADLGLTPESAYKIQSLRKKIQESGLEKHLPELNELLNPEQQTRLHQIHLQQAKINALRDSAVEKELGLTAGQHQLILWLYEKDRRAEMDRVKRMWNPVIPSKSVNNEKAADNGKVLSHEEKVLRVLSEEQQKAFEMLKGKPLDPSGSLHSMSLNGRIIKVPCVAFSPDGKWLTASRENEVGVWNTASGESTLSIKGHSGDVTCLTFSPDGKQIASGSSDRTVKLWDVLSGQEVRSFNCSHAVRAMAFNPDGNLLFAASGRVERRWNVLDGTFGREMHFLHDVWSLSISSDGEQTAYGFDDGSVDLRANAQNGKRFFFFNRKAHSGVVLSSAFSKEADRFATASLDGTVKIWDTKNGDETMSIMAHDKPIRSVAFSPDGAVLATASDDGTVKMWTVANGLNYMILNGGMDKVTCIAFSPEGTQLAVTGSDHHVQLLDTNSGHQRLSLNWRSKDAKVSE